MRRSPVLLVTLTAIAACGAPILPPTSPDAASPDAAVGDAGTAPDASGPGPDAGGPADAGDCGRCNTPPSASCNDSTTLVTYASQGSCVSGACTYLATVTTCPIACADAECVGPDGGPPPTDGGMCTDDSKCARDQYCAGTGCGTPGTCAARPRICPDDCTVPGVCGCDGRTYCNECLAEAAGTRVAPQDACSPADAGTSDAGSSAECTDDFECASNQYCAGTGCGTPGTCAARPQICPLYCTDPGVCGCDGRVYCNECLAEEAGTRVDTAGTCGSGGPDAGASDGGTGCTDDSQCATGEYCAGNGCGTPGTCAPLPGVCPLYCLYPGVCGCDGRLYCNECLAEEAGTRVAPQDMCPGSSDGGPATDGGTTAACTDDSECASDQYCAGTGCDTPGTCQPRPSPCPGVCAEPGVCGCNGETYCNECLAEAAGTRVDPDQSCLPPPADAGSPDAGSTCGTLLQEFDALVQATQSCTQDSDCLVDIVPCNVVGRCWVVVDQSTDTQASAVLQQMETDGCGTGVPICDCAVPPNSATCSNGVCTIGGVSPQ